MYKKLGSVFLCLLVLFVVIPKLAYAAISFEIVPPGGQLVRGQEVTFTINIDTGGESITTIQSGMTYVTTALEYVSSAAGPAMDSIQVDTTLGAGKLLFTGTKAAGFTGKDAFATVVFKIIATESGSTELCTLWQPTTTTPTPAPQCNGTCTTSADCPSNLYCSVPAGSTTGYCRMQACPDQIGCVCPVPTAPPVVPTALPTTGFDVPKNTGTIAGLIFLATAAGILFYSKRNKYTSRPLKHKKTHRS